MKPTLVVMAAGMGSRFGGLKQIEAVGPGGEIVLDYSVYDALRSGFGRVVFVIRRDIERAFRAVVEPRLGGRVELDYVFQELDDLPTGFAAPAGRTKPWGTGQAVWACRDAVRVPFGVINADDFYGPRSFALLGERLRGLSPTEQRHILVCFHLGHTLSEHGHVSRGVCRVNASGRLEGVEERTHIARRDGQIMAEDRHPPAALADDTPVSMNLWGFTPRLFESLGADFRGFLEQRGHDPKAEFYLPAHLDGLLRAGRASVDVVTSPETWLGMTYPADRAAVTHGIRRLIERGAYPHTLWSA